MAFQQSTRQPVQRVARPITPEAGTRTRRSSNSQLEESQTWVLFSPPTEATTASYLSGTEHSIETPGRSRLSDLGSLDTVARSTHLGDIPSSIVEDPSAEDDAELDSLDSHLPEFRSLPDGIEPNFAAGHQSQPLFPAHDGLGSFRLDRPVIGQEAQDRLYQFERFNPRKTHRRLDSAEQITLERDYSHNQEEEKRSRIEAWRLEHSRVLLDEVKRETRRRRASLASAQKHQLEETDALAWHDEDAVDNDVEDRGLIARLTRTVVKNVLGIDDKLLDILLGDVSVADDSELSATPQVSQLNENLPTDLEEQSWQLRLLETVSRELGKLVMPIPYAGLPVIPEAADVAAQEPSSRASQPEFHPTAGQTSRPVDVGGRGAQEQAEEPAAFTKEEWEQDLDIKLVFRYLVSRFKSRSTAPSVNTAYTSNTAPQDVAARIARVRQYHPLISRARPLERRTFRPSTPNSPVAMRHQSSCASQSTRRSARRSSVSSRHYWDIGGSLGTGSVIAQPGPMGSWGEV
ncbi:hypothetical protein VHEMI07381 [[Torrubiella] hemipterigena]|uniref:Uncharacterized protein n=1 Tax=[Torrubiella] hemipterigena TaxID=1531966 RepID=A0A0A1TLA8_9HYPO|nr:hypothetical protein VHEMI07381 [[Torrubiella] hemipterigena]